MKFGRVYLHGKEITVFKRRGGEEIFYEQVDVISTYSRKHTLKLLPLYLYSQVVWD